MGGRGIFEGLGSSDQLWVPGILRQFLVVKQEWRPRNRFCSRFPQQIVVEAWQLKQTASWGSHHSASPSSLLKLVTTTQDAAVFGGLWPLPFPRRKGERLSRIWLPVFDPSTALFSSHLHLGLASSKHWDFYLCPNKKCSLCIQIATLIAFKLSKWNNPSPQTLKALNSFFSFLALAHCGPAQCGNCFHILIPCSHFPHQSDDMKPLDS